MVPLAVVVPLVLAQGFGLDLTVEGPELRPSLAVVGVAEETPTGTSSRVSEALVRFAENGLFARVMTPDEVRDVLQSEEETAAALACREAACLDALAHRLGVDRVLVGEVTPEALGLLGYDWGSAQTHSLYIPVDQLRAAGFDRRVGPLVQPLLSQLATPLGQLEVTVEPPADEIRWGGRVLGSGEQVRATVPAGAHPLRVTAEGFVDYELPESVPSAGETKVEVTLEPKTVVIAEGAPDPTLQAERDRKAPVPSQPVVRNRRGLWVALAGAVVMGAGVAFGQSAQGVQRRAVDADGDGVLEVTRAEVHGARRNAVAANVLGGIGAAAVVGGAVWFFVDVEPAATASGAPNLSGGVTLHGSF